MFSWTNKQRLICAIHLVFLLMVLVPFLIWDEAIYEFTTNCLLNAGDTHVAGMIVLLLSLDVFLPVPSSVVGTVSGLLLG